MVVFRGGKKEGGGGGGGGAGGGGGGGGGGCTLEGFGDSGKDRIRVRNMHCGHVERYESRWWFE